MTEEDCTNLEWVIDDTMLPPPSDSKGLCILCDESIPQDTPKVPVKVTPHDKSPASSPPVSGSPNGPIPEEPIIPFLNDVYKLFKSPSLIQSPPKRRSIPAARRLDRSGKGWFIQRNQVDWEEWMTSVGESEN